MSEPARSYLFVPADRPDRFDKALASGADAVIIDLEDAVAPDAKSAARETLAAWLSPERPVHVRINAESTEWFEDDLKLCQKTSGIRAIVLPKVQKRIEKWPKISVLPLIETAEGFANINEISKSPNVDRLIFGSIDFQLDLGIPADNGEELLYFRSHIVLASRLGGLRPPVDGITTAFNNPELLRTETERSRRLGFGGKLCIHPKQVEIVNACFAPGPDEIAWAERVLAAVQAAGPAAMSGSAISYKGEMIDRPVLARAESILSRRAVH